VGEDELERSGSSSSPTSPPPERGPGESIQEETPAHDALAEPTPGEEPAPDSGPDNENSAEDLARHVSAPQTPDPPDTDGQPDLSDLLDWEDDPPPAAPNLRARKRGTLSKPSQRSREPHSPQQKLLLLDTWQRSGLPARDFGALVNVSRHTLYSWKKKFEQLGPAGLMDRPKGAKTGSRLPELTKRSILMLKQSHPDWGCQRISDMLLRGPALPASASAVARVLHEAGYEMEETPTRAHKAPVRSFERAKPNQLWQTDLFTFMLKRQNRRVYLVAFMDDHSRFITGYGLHASQSAALVIEVLRASLAAYGVPAEILTDNGSQYVTWRGKSQFRRELEKRGIQQIVARPRRPQTLGKIERFWGSLWRECVETSVFLDLADARQRIGLWIDYYNLQRAHQGIGGLVPADRFFSAAPEVLKTLKERVAANALELARQGIPKKSFYLTGQLGGKPFSVHREGDEVVLHQADRPREEIDLVAPEKDANGEDPPEVETLPRSLCPDGSPTTLWQATSHEVSPGRSPVDEIPKVEAEASAEAASAEDASVSLEDDPSPTPPEPGGDL
jgi:transposase InsO family protein